MKPDFSYKLTQKVENFIIENKMIGHGDFVLAGLSGGADSVCLFLLLNRLSLKLGFELHAIHVNHCIRGESAKRDEDFSKELCRKYNVPYTSYSADVPKIAADSGLTIEEAGRNARYDCFDKYAAELASKKQDTGKNINVKIAVAHHMNDQAETVLFNMIRGSGLKGIGGMQPVNGRIIRPLLCVTRSEIENYLDFTGNKYCIDETNSDNDYSRNLIRNEVIPDLNSIQPKTSEHIALMAAEAREAVCYIDEIVTTLFREACEQTENGYRLNAKALKNENPYIVRQLIIYVLKQMIERYKDITRIHIEDVYSLFSKGKGKYVMLPYGITARRDKDYVSIEREG